MTSVSFHCSHLTGVFVVLIYSAVFLLYANAGLGSGGLGDSASAFPQVQPRGTKEKYPGSNGLTAITYLDYSCP